MMLRHFVASFLASLAPSLLGNIRAFSVSGAPFLLVSPFIVLGNIQLRPSIGFLGADQAPTIAGLLKERLYNVVFRKGVPTRAMSFRGILFCQNVVTTAFYRSVGVIVAARPKKEMGWVDAQPVIAPMKDAHPIGDGAVMDCPRSTMRADLRLAVEPHSAVPGGALSRPRPIPASVVNTDNNFFHQSLFRIFPSHGWKDNAVA